MLKEPGTVSVTPGATWIPVTATVVDTVACRMIGPPFSV
jgi:hypothetical protein